MNHRHHKTYIIGTTQSLPSRLQGEGKQTIGRKKREKRQKGVGKVEDLCQGWKKKIADVDKKKGRKEKAEGSLSDKTKLNNPHTNYRRARIRKKEKAEGELPSTQLGACHLLSRP